MGSLFLYIVVFIITALLAKAAAFYYTLYKGTSYGEECFADDNCARSDVSLKAPKIMDKRERRHTLIKYIFMFIVAVLPLFFISAVRYGIGTDYFFTYVPNFYTILRGERTYTEYGFYLFNKLLQLFTDDPQWLFVITSFIFSFLFVRTIVHSSVNSEVSVVVLFCTMIYFWSMNNVRQAIAVILIFAAFPHLIAGHTVRYLIYVALAFVFHITALGMIVPYLIVRSGYVRRYFIYFAIALTVLLPIMCDVAVHMMNLTKYSYYFASGYNTGIPESIRTPYNLVIFLFAYLLLRKSLTKSNYAYTLTVMQFFAFWIVAISYFIGIPEMLVRLQNYFVVFQVLLVPYCIKRIRTITYKLIVFAIYTVVMGGYTISLLLVGHHEVIPYKWIFGVN